MLASLLLATATSAIAAETYSVEINGAGKALTDKLEIISDLKKELREYPTLASLRRAAQRDRDAFDAALTAAGYYLGKTSFEIERVHANEDRNTQVETSTEAKPKVIFTIDLGPAFNITEYEILYQDDHEGRPTTIAEMNITPTGSAAGADIQNVQVQVLNHLWDNGYPGAAIVGRRAIALPEKAEATAVFVFESGPKASFGDIEIDGLHRTHIDYIRKLKTWEPGTEYERAKIVTFRDRLGESGLFSSIGVSPGTPSVDGSAPILVNLEERKRRTIGAGLSFSTAEGPGARIFFENRNIFGRGESLRIELTGSQIQQAIDFTARKPFPELPGFAFANAGFANETTDAFDARTIRISSGLSKFWLDDQLETRAALALETSSVEADDFEERTFFVSLPLSVIWDSQNDLLQPTKGFRATATVTPYTGTDTFTQIETSARYRVFFGDDHRFVVAGRANAGATVGNSFLDLPINKRFFAGGGGSVRGFAFQEAGPLDADNDPIGGRSFVTGGAELRGKVSQNIQLAGFVDAGTVTSTSLPNFNDRIFVGYGAGVRYFTPIGPVRFDIAFPVNRRPSDSSFQIYIALGQPF